MGWHDVEGKGFRPTVPEIVSAPKRTEDPSATRFHFLKLAIVIIWGNKTCSSSAYKESAKRGSGKGRGEGDIPLLLCAGTSNVPVTLAALKLEYSVEVVVKVAVVVKFSSLAVGNVVVTTAFVIVVIGKKEPVGALAENTERT